MTADGSAELGVKLSDKAYWEIERRIITQELRPGHYLSERELAQQYNLGRTPVREALQRLARAGLVRIVPRRGVAVSDIDYRAEIEILPVRRELLRLMARLAAKKRTSMEATGFGQIAEAVSGAAGEGDALAFIQCECRFHNLLGTACRNDYAASGMQLIQGHYARFWYTLYQEHSDLASIAGLYRHLAVRIGEHQAEAATNVCDELIGKQEAIVRGLLELSAE
jgi:DNA-binding GntR family transcriptional regulator